MNEENSEPASEQPEMQQAPSSNAQMNALSLFAQAGAGNDFPVLKAFQEYLEAEQAKSRKRMLGLSIFFVTLLVVVVVAFSIIMAVVINRDQQNMSRIASRNQELSDKLLDIALRDRAPSVQPSVVNVQPAAQPQGQPQQDSMLRPLLEKIEHLATAMAESRQQTVHPAPVVVAGMPSLQSAAQVENAETIRLREELRREREAIAAVKAEQEKLKVEREKLRQEKIEQHRRRLYPDYYAREDARLAAEESARKKEADTPKREVADKIAKSEPEKPKQTSPVGKGAHPEPLKPKVETQKEKLGEPALPRSLPPKPKAKADIRPIDIRTAKPIQYFAEPNETTQAKKLEPIPPPAPKTQQQAPAPQQGPVPPSDVKKSPVTKQEVPASPPATKNKMAETPSGTSSTNRSDVISIGANGGETIPFYIELPAETK